MIIVDKAPRLSISIVIWILSSCQLNQFNTNCEAAMLSRLLLIPLLSVSESLPTTAYIKMIDVWLIFNLLKPFIDIIVQTYIESLREADSTKVCFDVKTLKPDFL